MQQTIGVVILTYHSKHHLPNCLPPFLQSPLKPKILIVDSSSNDGTIELAETYGIESIQIPQSQFNHGATREMARKLLKTDIVVMVTPDAYALNEHVLEKLVQPICEGKASIAYARQIPHEGASFFEAFPREFNYPGESQLRSIHDIEKYGVYTFFCSDSCAAYCNQALDNIGGFKPVLLGEDTVATAEMLRKGYKIAYAADAVVRHSHGYSLKQEFKRYFDTGIARNHYHELIATKSKDSKRGGQFVKQMTKKLAKESPHLLPYAVIQTFAKWLGYQIGQRSVRAPNWFKRRLSSQPYFWKD